MVDGGEPGVDVLWVTMMDTGYPLHLIDLLAKLYRKQLAKVKVARTLSEWFRAEKRVRQGCVLSPYFQHPSGDGDEGDLRWISRWTTSRCGQEDSPWKSHSE